MNYSQISLHRIDSYEQARINRAIILNTVRMNGPMSQRELVDATGLRPSTVSMIVNSLQQEGLLRRSEVTRKTIGRGRPQVLMEINPSYASFVGIEVTLEGCVTTLKDACGRTLSRNVVSRSVTRENVVDTVLACLDRITGGAGRSDSIRGIGIGFPGIVDRDTGTILHSCAFDMHDVPLEAEIEARAGVEVSIDRDVNVAAIAELENGQRAHQCSDLLYVLIRCESGGTLGATGIGFGIIVDRQLYRGAFMSAGEHFSPFPSLRQRILTAIQDGVAPASECSQAVASLKGADWVGWLMNAVSGGHQLVTAKLREAAQELGSYIAYLVGALNPEIVVLSGELVDPAGIFVGEVKRQIAGNYYSRFIRQPEVCASTLGNDSVSDGAALLVLLEEIFGLPVIRVPRTTLLHTDSAPGSSEISRMNRVE